MYNHLAQYEQALSYYHEALTISQGIGYRYGEGAALYNLGRSYSRLGQDELALDYYQQALIISQAVGARGGEVQTLNVIGILYSRLEQYQQALDYYQQALALSRAISDRHSEALSLTGIGRVYGDLGQYEQAMTYLTHALTISQEIGSLFSEMDALYNIGKVYYHMDQSEQVLVYYNEALAICQEIGNRDGEGAILSNVGEVLAEIGQPELAIVFYKQSVNVRETIRDDIRGLPQEVQQSYTETVAEDYRALADLLLQQNRVLEAQRVLDLLKVQELDDYLRDVRGNDRTAEGVDYLPPEQDLLALYDRAINQGIELAQLREIPMGDRTPAQQERLAALVAIQQELSLSFDEFLDRPDVQELVDQLTRTTRRQNLDLEYLTSIQDNLRNLNQNAVLLYPLILEDRLELILVTPYTPPIRRTVSVTRDELN